jgi:hypothetical protein
MMTKAEKEDLVLGSIYGALPVLIIGFWALLTIPLCSFFWYKAGRVGSSWRVYGCTATAWTPMFMISLDFWLIPLAILCAIISSIGWGIPSVNDSGSTLGKFYYKLFKGNELLTNIATRGTIYGGILFCFLIAIVRNASLP